MHDALTGRYRGPDWARSAVDKFRVSLRHTFHRLGWLRVLALIVYAFILPVFERPAWCYGADDEASAVHP